MSIVPSREEALFSAALAQPPAERAAFLANACGSDAALKERILALLKVHAGSESLLGGFAPSRELLEQEKPGAAIGHYKLLQKIGEGGCGVVWMAEQEEPVRRRVALKIIKLGMDTKAVVARFEVERQALAMMDHPNIAKVHDAGATDAGRPFFVMELVRGIPITKCCDENNLTPTARLELFIKVCQAVQHAHQKGIIHRDLKPSNILVTVNDGAPTPKVIDFGIAKATQGRLTDATMLTQLEQFIGTPLYMSPEQAEMTSLDIDTRTDIYSLGVLLYELLAGRPPFDPEVLLAGGLDEIRRIIRNVEPPRPSARLSTLADFDRDRVARHRSAAPAQLATLLRGDLDWIVMRCLEKDRRRRYESANGLAMDVQRHLDHHPVVARPPSTLYSLQKFIRRRRLAFATGTAIAATLVGGVIASTWQAVRAQRAEKLAEARFHAEQSARRETERQRAAADAERNRAVGAERLAAGRAEAEQAARREAERQTTVAEQESVRAREAERAANAAARKSDLVASFMTDMLKGVGPQVALGRDTQLLRDIVNDTADRLDELRDQPAVEADLRATLGRLYLAVGDVARAEQMYRRELALRRQLVGDDHIDVAQVMQNLAQALGRQRSAEKKEEAVRMSSDAIAIRQRLEGEARSATAHPVRALGRTLRASGKLEESERVLRDLVKARRAQYGPEQPETADALGELGDTLVAAGQYGEAIGVYREALAIWRKVHGDEHPALARTLSDLGWALAQEGAPAGGEAELRAALAMQRKLLPPDGLELRQTLRHLSSTLLTNGKFAEAESLLREIVVLQTRVVGDRHPERAPVLELLGHALTGLGRHAEAEQVFRQAIDLRREFLAPDHPDIARSLSSFAAFCEAQGRYADAAASEREALAIRRKAFGPDTPEVARSLFALAGILHQEGRLAEAESVMSEGVALRRRLDPAGSPELAACLGRLGIIVSQQGRSAEALALHNEAWQLKKQLSGPDDCETLNALVRIAAVHRGDGRLDEAAVIYTEVIAGRRRTLGPEHHDTLEAMSNLAGVRRSQGKFGDAAALLGEVVDIRKRSLGVDHEATQRAMSNLAAVLLRQGKAADAVVAYSEVLAARKRVLGADHLETAATMVALASAHQANRQVPQAAELHRQALQIRNAKLGSEHPLTLESASAFGRVLLVMRRHEPAETVLRAVVRLRNKISPDDWQTAFDTLQLGEALVGLRRFDEGGKFLETGFSGLKEHAASIPKDAQQRIRQAGTRLVALLKVRQWPGEADRWEMQFGDLITEIQRADTSAKP